ncbi:MAG: DUF2249 domain-containing protein [Firmicutes bacterium]|nr:DUF2249 domain-containing protein [Bacillota bacterium]
MAENAVDAVVISAPVIPPRFRHETIFGVLEALPVGYSALLLNDHDPKPLLYQLEAEQPGVFSHEYVEQGPERYAVRFTRKSAE